MQDSGVSQDLAKLDQEAVELATKMGTAKEHDGLIHGHCAGPSHAGFPEARADRRRIARGSCQSVG
eukprot:1099109-Alexandrium_andersonii.AAC.1